MTYKGEVVTASAQHNSELLWASCGGGGALGVVSQWTIKAHDLGNQPFSRIMVRACVGGLLLPFTTFQQIQNCQAGAL